MRKYSSDGKVAPAQSPYVACDSEAGGSLYGLKPLANN